MAQLVWNPDRGHQRTPFARDGRTRAASQDIVAKSGIPLDQIAYAGDDLTDLVIMRRVGLAIAVANARPEVKRAAHYVTTARGGSGAIREICELILEAHGRWKEILRKYEAE